MATEQVIRGYSVIIFDGAEFDQNDGWYYQISEQAKTDDVTYTEPEGPYLTQEAAGQAASGRLRGAR